MDTSFAQYESAWCGSETQTNAIDRVGIDENEEIMLQDGILPSSLPMQAEIGGKKVMVFQAYDSARGILNSSVLKYSVYENGAWSVPQPVWDNGFCDMYADMKTVNGKLVLVWQKEKTAIFIAHRLSTIVNVDKIIVLSNGEIVEEGNHNELVQTGGYYSKLYNAYYESLG
jgi:hypothetical protein